MLAYTSCRGKLLFSISRHSHSLYTLFVVPGSISGVFRAPIRAIHTSGEQQLSCFVYLELLEGDPLTVQVTAVEYARRQREELLRREFGSWLLEDHIEQSVIATDLAGTVGASVAVLSPSEFLDRIILQPTTQLLPPSHIWHHFLLYNSSVLEQICYGALSVDTRRGRRTEYRESDILRHDTGTGGGDYSKARARRALERILLCA